VKRVEVGAERQREPFGEEREEDERVMAFGRVREQ